MNRIRKLREELGLKQKDLAKLIGCAENTISYWENEGRALSPDTITALCRLFKVSADYLLCLSDWRGSAVSDEDAALIYAYHAAPPHIREAIDKILTDYAKEKKESAVG